MAPDTEAIVMPDHASDYSSCEPYLRSLLAYLTMTASMTTSLNDPDVFTSNCNTINQLRFSMCTVAQIVRQMTCKRPMIMSHAFLFDPKIEIESAVTPYINLSDQGSHISDSSDAVFAGSSP